MDKSQISVEYRKEYGVVIFVDDWNLADDFEDYLATEEYVLYDMTTEDFEANRRTGFWFGSVSALEKARSLVDRFCDSRKK